MTSSTLFTIYGASKSTTNDGMSSFSVVAQNNLYGFPLPSTAFFAGNPFLVELMYAGLFKAKFSPETAHTFRADENKNNVVKIALDKKTFARPSNFAANE